MCASVSGHEALNTYPLISRRWFRNLSSGKAVISGAQLRNINQSESTDQRLMNKVELAGNEHHQQGTKDPTGFGSNQYHGPQAHNSQKKGQKCHVWSTPYCKVFSLKKFKPYGFQASLTGPRVFECTHLLKIPSANTTNNERRALKRKKIQVETHVE